MTEGAATPCTGSVDPGTIVAWGRIDPYFVWAERTCYAGMPLPDAKYVPVLIEVRAHALQLFLLAELEVVFGAERVKASVWGDVYPGFIALRVKKDFIATLLEWITKNLQWRWELGLPFASPVVLPLITDSTLPPRPRVPANKRVVGIIDYGCAFAHRQFRDWSTGVPGPGTRVFALWDQAGSGAANRVPARSAGLQPPGWLEPDCFHYGSEWWRDISPDGEGLGINAYIEQFARHGAIDEEACYACSGYDAVQAPVTHGTHVMDVATGRPNPQLPPDKIENYPAETEIVFVQLPRYFDGRQVSGLLRTYVLDAVNYIFRCAEPETPVTINLSYGAYAGAHDGESILELALDAAIQHRRERRGQTDIVIAAGNGADARAHVELQVPAGHTETLIWHNVPDNPTDQLTEFWFDAGSDCHLRITPPGEQPDPHAWVQRGQWHETMRSGSTLSLLTFAKEVGQSPTRPMALLAVAPTVRCGAREAAPYGRWAVEIFNGAAEAACVKAWIERDDPVFQSGSGPRQARFEGSAVTSRETISSLANGQLTIAVGGYVGIGGRQPAYSAQGPARGACPAKLRPEWLAVCEENQALPGLAAAAVFGLERVRLAGTSAAAAAATRYVVEARRNNPSDFGPVQAPPPGSDDDGKFHMPRVPNELPRRGDR